MNYLAISIGPVYPTISQARKTRELWAASFIFSLLMREILKQIKTDQILIPNFDHQHPDVKLHGAGLWPDRCVVALPQGKVPDFQVIKDDALTNLAGILGIKPSDIEPLFQIYALHANWKQSDLDSGINDDDQIPIHRIIRLLVNLELTATFQSIETTSLNRILISRIQDLYGQGFDLKAGKVFIDLDDGTIRLPSLPENGDVFTPNVI
jgi:hypothetical protein